MRRFARFSACAFVVTLSVAICQLRNASAASPSAASSPAPPMTPQQIQLRAMANAGTLSDLRWPDFSNIKPQVLSFYDAGNYQPAWTVSGKPIPQAAAMIAEFKNASDEGLNPEDYDAARWDARMAKVQSSSPPPSPDELDDFDLAMTVSAMRLVSDLHDGRVDPRILKIGLDSNAAHFDLPAAIRTLILPSANMDAAIQSVEPPYAGYKRAEGALATYLKMAAAGDTKPLAVPDKSIHPGNQYPAIADLAARLKQLGDLPADTDIPATQTQYKGPIVDGVKHFQDRLGLEPDGILGKGTVTELNRPLSYRVEQLQLTLERYRWIPTSFPDPPILINIPEFMLRTMRKQPAPFLKMRVIVGKAYGKQTPVFADYMKWVIFHPYWDVPPSILHGEIVGKISRNRDYVADNDFEVVDDSDNVVTDDSISDDVLQGLRSGRYRVRQKPGDKNALGPIKFIFPNDYDVYLHGTPAQSLFSHARRDFSHGCIRVENPEALADWVLRDQPGWDPNRIKETLAGDETVRVNLTKPIPVLILYSTAVVEPDGEVKFFDDIYGYDKRLKELLATGYPPKG